MTPALVADEDNETFTVTLTTPFNALLGTTTSATVTITDDDAAPTVAWGTTSFSAGEGQGNARLSVELSAPSSRTITVNYATSDGSAKAGNDYTAASGTKKKKM